MNDLCEWHNQCIHNSTIEFSTYLYRRNKGGEREYFKTISHILEFLKKISPTKNVDGAWLYSMINYWNDEKFTDLIIIYLEELGLGNPKHNHVKIFNDLLEGLTVNELNIKLSDEYYHQGCIQLALSYCDIDYIPEILGFNLGYEQLPLHLLITNYEMKELGVDSQYFNLHITVDNLDNGHAKKAINSLIKIASEYEDENLFFEKLKRGYLLNFVGLNSTDIVKNLNSEQIIKDIFHNKSIIGKNMHSDKCILSGMTVNEWLSTPEYVDHFLNVLIEKRFIILGSDPKHSMFWKMITEHDGVMFGVFNNAEKQFIFDWILGDNIKKNKIANLVYKFKSDEYYNYSYNYLNNDELREIQNQLSACDSLAIKIENIIPYLAPHLHHKNKGLWCTHMFTQLLYPQLTNPNVKLANI